MPAPWNPHLLKAYWLFAGLGALYAVFCGTLTIPTVQKNLLYLHKVNIPWFVDITRPEQFGFAKGQATPFYLTTLDDESLFAWHILPSGVYAEHRDELSNQEEGVAEDITKTFGFKLLKRDPEARIVIYLHGNAGTIPQGYRPDAIRNFLSASDKHAHVLIFDYRGFGLSTGTPSEEGLILDGQAAINFAMKTLRIPASRIVVVGHSLGTAVTLGVTEKMAREEKIEFGGIILVAAFTNLKSLVLTYSIGGIIPLLGPLRPYPFVQRQLQKFIVERWDSQTRLGSLIKHSPNLRLTLIHAYNDMEITYTNSDELFRAGVNAIVKEGLVESEESIADYKELTIEKVDRKTKREELGSEGWRNIWREDVEHMFGGRKFEERILRWGGHNQVLTGSVVALEVRRFMGLTIDY